MQYNIARYAPSGDAWCFTQTNPNATGISMSHETVGSSDWAYGHNRLTYPGESIMHYKFTIGNEMLMNPSSQVIIKLNYFAPW